MPTGHGTPHSARSAALSLWRDGSYAGVSLVYWCAVCLLHPRNAQSATALQQAVPWLSPHGHDILGALVACEGRTRPVEAFAHNAGFTSRHQLARVLQRDGLPPLEELGAWIYVLERLWDWEMSHVSLCKSALWSGEDPGDHYRRVQRLCGVRWSEARAMGFNQVLVRFVQRCGSRDLQREQSAV